MYEDLVIDPLTHEEALKKATSYIDLRLRSLQNFSYADSISEINKLLNRIKEVGLKGNHPHLIIATLFKLIKEQKVNDKDRLIDELLYHKFFMENDIMDVFHDKEEHFLKFYVMDAYFPLKEKELHIAVMATSYHEAVFIIRKTYGEFHLQSKKDFKFLECEYAEMEIKNNRMGLLCRLLNGGECPVFTTNVNSCVKDGYESFNSGLNKDLEIILGYNATS